MELEARGRRISGRNISRNIIRAKVVTDKKVKIEVHTNKGKTRNVMEKKPSQS